jgi:hypothetical protein
MVNDGVSNCGRRAGGATILMVLKHRVICMEHLQENLKLITSAGNTCNPNLVWRGKRTKNSICMRIGKKNEKLWVAQYI